jgi:hypothetical protein
MTNFQSKLLVLPAVAFTLAVTVLPSSAQVVNTSCCPNLMTCTTTSFPAVITQDNNFSDKKFWLYSGGRPYYYGGRQLISLPPRRANLLDALFGGL